MGNNSAYGRVAKKAALASRPTQESARSGDEESTAERADGRDSVSGVRQVTGSR